MPKTDRPTNLDGGQIKNGAIGTSELATKHVLVDNADPVAKKVLKIVDTPSGEVYEFDWEYQVAEDVLTDTTNFNGALSITEDTVQKALDRLDNVVGVFVDGVKEHIFRPERVGSYENYKVKQLASAGSDRFTFFIPEDFNALTSLEMIFIPSNTIVSSTIDLESNYAQIGELSTTHAESNAGELLSATADTISLKDISSVFTNIEAGDICGLYWKNNTIASNLYLLGIRLRYT